MESRRYNEWQTLAYEATTDRKGDFTEEETGPLVDHPSYPTPTKILIRLRKGEDEKITKVEKIASLSNKEMIDQIESQDQTDDSCQLDFKDQRSPKSIFVINTFREIDEVDRV